MIDEERLRRWGRITREEAVARADTIPLWLAELVLSTDDDLDLGRAIYEEVEMSPTGEGP